MPEEKRPSNHFLGFTDKCEAWRIKVIESICSQKAFRHGPKLLMKAALGVVLCMSLTWGWYWSRMPDGSDGSVHLNDTKLDAHENTTTGSLTGGLRMVVFGGGDVATPNYADNDEQYAWTEIMCRELECDSYLSLIPGFDHLDGAVVSNPLLDAAYKRLSDRHVNKTKLDYSWAADQYPRPDLPDLATQVRSFLSTPKSQETYTETLWVFNVGYWDIWHLAALPRKLATSVIDSTIRDLFFQIETLYQASQDADSIASSDYYSQFNESSLDSGDCPRIPFRIFLTRLFDISLTPGFASARPDPPSPHLRSEQLRNAAFLTHYWNSLLELTVDDWLMTPDPDDWSTADSIDLDVVKVLMGKQMLGLGDHRDDDEVRAYTTKGVSLPFRALASYGMSTYLQELMIDNQLRKTELYDHNGLGARPLEYGFLDISMPCALPLPGDVEDVEAEDREPTVVVCQGPDDYLFYTELILGQRAIREVGTRAAARFLEQVEPHSKWKERAVLKQEQEDDRDEDETEEEEMEQIQNRKRRGS